MFSDAKKKFGLVILLLAAGFFVLPVKAVDFGSVVINEIAWMGISGNQYGEWIEIYNASSEEIDLNNWKLYKHKDGGEVLIFTLTKKITPGGYLVIERTTDSSPDPLPGIDDESGKFGGGNFINLPNGEHLILKNADNIVVEDLDFSSGWPAGKASPDYKTMERKNPLTDGNNSDNWGISQNLGGTPKAQNSVFQSSEPTPIPTPTLTPTPTPTPASTPTPSPTPTYSPALTPTPSPTPAAEPTVYSRLIVINEFIPDPVGSDTEGEWIELFNEGNEPVDLGDWKLADQASKYPVPKNTIIGAKSFLVFYRPVTKISINNDGETLSLLDPNSDLAFKISYEGKAPEGQSLARQSDNKWFWTVSPTPGGQNIIKAAETKTAATKTPTSKDSEKAISPSPVSANLPISTSLPAREETAAGAPAKSSNLVSSASSPKQGNSSQVQSEAGEDYFSGKNQAATLVETGWLNYKITGIAVLLGLFSVAGILLLKRFL